MRPLRVAGMVVLLLVPALPGRTLATPLDYIPVGDPLEDELRILDVLGPAVSLPRLGMRPLEVIELPEFRAAERGPAATIARDRLRRALARDDGADLDTIPGAGRRLFEYRYEGDQRVQASVALEGRGRTERRRDPDFIAPSGIHMRLGVQTGHWLAFSHLIAGHFDDGLRYGAPIVPGNDFTLGAEEAFLAYTADQARWSAQLGRSRWHWGPGEEASLLLSKTSAPLAGLALHLRIEPLRADGMVLSATLDAAGGEQLAAHRLEWQPRDGMRIGLSEAARYKSPTWQPLYGAGVLPYSLVQNLLARDQPDSTRAVRNNVQAAFDVTWRFAPGRRVYTEILIDDIKTAPSPAVNKYGYQAGVEGAGAVRHQRLTWGAEYTRITAYVYTSFFGRTFAAQGHPLGFPTGPDARRIRLRGAWDPSVSWQMFASATRTDLGESGLDVPYVPGTPHANPETLTGVVENTRDLEIGARYWPSAWLDLALVAGYRWVDNAAHVSGAREQAARAELRVRVAR